MAELWEEVPPGILTDRRITLFSDRLFHLNYDKTKVEACSYDLTVSEVVMDNQGSNCFQDDNALLIEPGKIVSFLTKEVLTIPNDCSAFVYAPNNYSASGLLILNPGHVDPGFQGRLTLVAICIRKTQLSLSKNPSLFTIVFIKLPEPVLSPFPNRENEMDDLLNKQIETFRNRATSCLPSSLETLLTGNEKEQIVSSRIIESTISAKFADSSSKEFVKKSDIESVILKDLRTWILLILALGAIGLSSLKSCSDNSSTLTELKVQVAELKGRIAEKNVQPIADRSEKATSPHKPAIITK